MNRFKLLIVGAGASGIAAGSKLLENGFSDFRILEAEDRIGGRINTVTLGNEFIELGAEWIHGEVNNAVYELALKSDLADNSPSTLQFQNTTFFDHSGHQINKDVSRALSVAYYEIMSTDGKDLQKEVLQGSVGDYFEIEYKKKIEELRKFINIEDKLCKNFQRVFENWENSIDASDSWYETSLSGHLEYWECEGNILTVWKNNQYNTIFKLLTKQIPDPSKQLPINDKILLNKEVVKIKWNREHKLNVPNVEVGCLDGSVFYADHILITCSLGVLKERGGELFLPSLPAQKLKCIENLGFGTVDKIFVKFENKWWDDDCEGFAFLWSEEEIKNDSSGWLNGVICFHPVTPSSNLLRGWITAKTARHMESLSNSEIVKGLNYLFDKFLGSSLQVAPIEVCLTSRWYSNPHFRGSYSCRLMNSEFNDVWASQLAEPVCNNRGKPILLFGGEATHDHYFSTVHGAIEAGRREAIRLLPVLMRNPKNKEKYQVVIVGAGISGLSAANTLYKNGISSIKILEAQSYPGGRIRSLKVGEYCLELGAQWIHGDKNEVFNICKENDLVTEDYSSEGEGLYLRENGDVIAENIVQEVDDVVKDILENCENYASCKYTKEIPNSIGEELLIKFDEYLKNCEDTEETKLIKKELFDWHVRYQLIDNSCSDLDNLSAKAWGLFRFCGGNDYVNFKNGYSSLINTLVNNLPQNIISYNTAVERIEWTEKILGNSDSNLNCFVNIICNDGVSYHSDYIIVTSSLGYLKNNYKKMFRPPLPHYLTEAIEYLDFGVMNKIFLIYNSPWWEPGTKGFQLIWSRDPSICSQQHWARCMTGFDVILKGKPLLLGWIGGEGAKAVEQMTEEQVGREATQILRSFTKNPNIPLPDKVVITKWWTNEYIRGAYSHITIKCDESDINASTLAQPVCTIIHGEKQIIEKPTILLAGESTHKSHYSTVHGAYESGQAQAQVIINHLNSSHNLQ